MAKKAELTANDIESVQIIATLKDGKHIMAITDDRILINMMASFCQFVKLKDELFEQCSLKEIME